jgi:hypothetical protein
LARQQQHSNPIRPDERGSQRFVVETNDQHVALQARSPKQNVEADLRSAVGAGWVPIAHHDDLRAPHLGQQLL